MSAFLVTTSTRGTSRTQVWHPERPLALGHPFQWVIEKTEAGVRVRRVGGKPGERIQNATQEIPLSDLHAPGDAPLKIHAPFELRIRPVTEIAPAYGSRVGTELTAYTCVGGWVLSSARLSGPQAKFSARAQGKTVFKLASQGGAYQVRFETEGARVRRSTLSAAENCATGQTLTLSLAELAEAVITWNGTLWRFGLSSALALPAGFQETTPVASDPELDWFKKSIRGTTLALLGFIALAWFWPKPQENPAEIPIQVAKIVLQKTVQKAPAAAQAESPNPTQANTSTDKAPAPVPKKVQEAAVVQAFRAKALQNAVSGLLKGGMTRLMVQSEFVAGTKDLANARRIFDSKSSSLQSSAPEAGTLGNRSVQVAAAGGAAGGAKGVGYSKGEKAGVKGQGGAFVSMDVPNSSVEEGLTKDEVGEVIHRHLSEVRYCYESAMIRTPDIEGKLIVNFTIGGNGVVKSSEVKSSTLPDPRLDDCIVRRLVTWKFPQTKGGVDVAVSYPFIFKTLGR